MSDQYEKYVGSWIKLSCRNFICSGKIELINKDKIVLSNADLSNAKVSTRFIGIDIHLIVEMDFIQPIYDREKIPETIKTEEKKLLNVYTSETQPPPIKRGGSSSAVNRNLTRQSHASQEKFSKMKNSSFSDFGAGMRKNSNSNQTIEPAWLNFSPKDFNSDFDFDTNLALFDKESLFGSVKKSSNESNNNDDKSATHFLLGGSDSSDSVCLKVNINQRQNKSNTQSKKTRANTISFDPNDFSLYNEHDKSNCIDSDKGKKRDILSEFKLIGIIPSTNVNLIDNNNQYDQQSKHSFEKFQQPDLVREITQKQLINNKVRNLAKFSTISINSKTKHFSDFNEFWNLDNDYTFPVFTIAQRDLLFDTASQLGIDNEIINETIGETISDFVITQVGGFIRINESNLNRVPKIAILLAQCSASVYAASVAKYLLKKGCHILVLVDENKISEVNYRITKEIKKLHDLLVKNGPTLGYNFVTYDAKDLAHKAFDFVISGVECDSSMNKPSGLLRNWCLRQQSHLLCINPPIISNLSWKSAVFVGVPTSSYDQLYIRTNMKIDNFVSLKPFAKDSYSIFDQEKNFRKPEGIILLCNVNLPDRVFSFLNLNYRSPFTTKNWVRLYKDNDLCLVE